MHVVLVLHLESDTEALVDLGLVQNRLELVELVLGPHKVGEQLDDL